MYPRHSDLLIGTKRKEVLEKLQQFNLKEEEVASIGVLVGCSRYVWFNTVNLGEDRSNEHIGTQSAFLLDAVVHHQGLARLLCHLRKSNTKSAVLEAQTAFQGHIAGKQDIGAFWLGFGFPQTLSPHTALVQRKVAEKVWNAAKEHEKRLFEEDPVTYFLPVVMEDLSKFTPSTQAPTTETRGAAKRNKEGGGVCAAASAPPFMNIAAFQEHRQARERQEEMFKEQMANELREQEEAEGLFFSEEGRDDDSSSDYEP